MGGGGGGRGEHYGEVLSPNHIGSQARICCQVDIARWSDMYVLVGEKWIVEWDKIGFC